VHIEAAAKGRDSIDVMCCGRPFQMWAAATRTARSWMVCHWLVV